MTFHRSITTLRFRSGFGFGFGFGPARALLVLLAAAFWLLAGRSASAQWTTPAVEAPGVQQRSFRSDAAGRMVSYHVWTPPAYEAEPQRRFPVIYWLHGSGEGIRGIPMVSQWFARAIEAELMPPVLVVFPHGMPTSMWCDSHDGRVPMETVVIREVLPEVDASFRTIAGREGRILEGFSMGGHGTGRLAFRHPHLFAGASMLGAGPLQQDFRVGPEGSEIDPRQRRFIFQRVWGGDPAVYLEQHPGTIAEAEQDDIRENGLRVRVVVGAEDHLRPDNLAFHEHLKRIGIPHEFRVVPDVGHQPLPLLRGLGDDGWRFYREVLAEAAAADEPAAAPSVPDRDDRAARRAERQARADRPDRPGRAADRRVPDGPHAACSLILGRPTDRSVTLSVLSREAAEAFVSFGPADEPARHRTARRALPAGEPVEFELTGLPADSACHYRLHLRPAGGSGESGESAAFTPGPEHEFRTQRAAGEAFTFAVMGDSHPERVGRMFDAGLYQVALGNIAADRPDFVVMMGDDFSLSALARRGGPVDPAEVAAVYRRQRGYLGLMGSASPLMHVVGNHEQMAGRWLDGTPENLAVAAARARSRFLPLPSPDGFYSGNDQPDEHAGHLRDYYAWQWGDALFVVISPYWHTATAVDGEADAPGATRTRRDGWNITLGERQYRWFVRTLEETTARHRFVFAHHVNGTGRGGVSLAGQYEWGGRDPRGGADRFDERRPGWGRPIHEVMRDAGVTIFFQGHDHLYAREELDGVVYQTCPSPADHTFGAVNADAFAGGTVLPNAGHLRVTVDGDAVRVEYVRAWPEDAGGGGDRDGGGGDDGDDGDTPARVNREVAHAYTASRRKPRPE